MSPETEIPLEERKSLHESLAEKAAFNAEAAKNKERAVESDQSLTEQFAAGLERINAELLAVQSELKEMDSGSEIIAEGLGEAAVADNPSLKEKREGLERKVRVLQRGKSHLESAISSAESRVERSNVESADHKETAAAVQEEAAEMYQSDVELQGALEEEAETIHIKRREDRAALRDGKIRGLVAKEASGIGVQGEDYLALLGKVNSALEASRTRREFEDSFRQAMIGETPVSQALKTPEGQVYAEIMRSDLGNILDQYYAIDGTEKAS